MRKLLAVLVLCSLGADSVPEEKRPKLGEQVSLVRLISTPSDFDGKKVIVQGFATFGIENEALYLSEAHAKMLSTPDSVVFKFSGELLLHRPTKLHRKYIVVAGVFSAPPPKGDRAGLIEVEWMQLATMGW